MVNRFFAEIFGIGFVIIMLLNLMMHFEYGSFHDNMYFGITTFIDVLDPANHPVGGITTNIISYMDWVKRAVPKFTEAMKEFRATVFTHDQLVNQQLENLGVLAYLAMGVYEIIKGISFLVEVVGVLGMYLVFTFMYLVYLIEIFMELITGSYYSIMPTNIWTYPPVQFSYGFIM